MWKDFISSLTDHAEFSTPATWTAICEAEKSLGVTFPSPLQELLRESNGVQGEFGIGLVWSVDRIQRDNLAFRESNVFLDLYMPFDHLLFFADAGNGDQFAYPIHNCAINQADIFVWNHENDDRRWVAGSLKQYLQWWLDGTLAV